MNLPSAIEFANLVQAAYAIDPKNLVNSAGQIVPPNGGAGIAFQVVTSVYSNDLATDMNPPRGGDIVSIGLVLQSTGTGDAVVALRGTEGIMEWIQDAKFLAVPCPFLQGAGNTEDGFTAMYRSLSAMADLSAPLAGTLATLAWPRPVTSLTIAGHSLGGALVTLLALDLAAHAQPPLNTPVVYTYASPKTGDPQFVDTYNHLVPDTVRIANRVDLVPKLPLPPLYEHVGGLVDLNPVTLGPPPAVLVKLSIPCEHFLSTYLHLLTLGAGGAVTPLEAQCVP